MNPFIWLFTIEGDSRFLGFLNKLFNLLFDLILLNHLGVTWYLMSSELHYFHCLWIWRQLPACEQCLQWSCPPGSSPCPLCQCTYLKKDCMYLSKIQRSCYITCYNHNCTGTWNIHAIGFRNKMEGISCVFIIESHLYLYVECYLMIQYLHIIRFQPVARVE